MVRIQKAPLRIFRTFICIKRIPPLRPFLCCLSGSLPFFLYNCSRRSFSSPIRYLWKHFYFLFLSLYSRLNTKYTRYFASIHPSAPLHCNFQPFLSSLSSSALFATHCLSTLCVFSRNSNASSTLEYLLTLFSKLLFYYFTSPFFLAKFFSTVIQHFYYFSLMCYRASLILSLYFSAYVSSYTSVCFYFFYLPLSFTSCYISTFIHQQHFYCLLIN